VKGRPNLLLREDLLSAPVQKRSREKYELLKAAALALFGEKGYEQTSIDDIASRAQIAVGGFYQHFRSKRQLLLVLMDEFLERLASLNLTPGSFTDPRSGLRDLLARAFAHDFYYVGAYRAWQEAMLSDADLARKNVAIHAWTTMRVLAVFEYLYKFSNTRPGVNLRSLARSMDAFFWSLLARAVHMPKPELNQWIDSATHLIYHALFADPR
jgi:AcrR family transcriptional regulator